MPEDEIPLTGTVYRYAPNGEAYKDRPPIRRVKTPKTTVGKLWVKYRDIREARKSSHGFDF